MKNNLLGAMRVILWDLLRASIVRVLDIVKKKESKPNLVLELFSFSGARASPVGIWLHSLQ